MAHQLTIDLNSVSYVKYFYENRRGDTRRVKPRYPTVNGSAVATDAIAFNNVAGEPVETMLQRATRLKLLDVWMPVCIYQFRNNHSMRFSGDKAKQMKQSYDKHIYKKS